MSPRAGGDPPEPAGARPALALVGFMGSGKSTVGALVAARTGAAHRDLDAMVEAVCGVAIADLFAGSGEAAFRDLEARLLPAALEAGAVVSLGGGAPMRDASWDLIRARSLTVWLDVPLPELLARLGRRTSRPLVAGRGEGEVGALLRERLPRYGQAHHRVDGARPADVVAEEVCRLWSTGP